MTRSRLLRDPSEEKAPLQVNLNEYLVYQWETGAQWFYSMPECEMPTFDTLQARGGNPDPLQHVFQYRDDLKGIHGQVKSMMAFLELTEQI